MSTLRLRDVVILLVVYVALLALAYQFTKDYKVQAPVVVTWPLFTTLSVGFILHGLAQARDGKLMAELMAGHDVPATRERPVDGRRVRIIGMLRAFGETMRAPFSGTDSVFYVYAAGSFEEKPFEDVQHLLQGASRLGPDYQGYGRVPCYVHSTIGDIK